MGGGGQVFCCASLSGQEPKQSSKPGPHGWAEMQPVSLSCKHKSNAYFAERYNRKYIFASELWNPC
jgi:hypothetical protein